jgi:hypothetical protein
LWTNWAPLSCSSDTLADGDLLLFHNLLEKEFTKPLQNAIHHNVLFSPTRLADTTLKAAAEVEAYAHLRYPKATLAIMRLA